MSGGQAHAWGYEWCGPITWLTVWHGDMGYSALNPSNRRPAEQMEMTERWKARKSKMRIPHFFPHAARFTLIYARRDEKANSRL